MKMNGFTLVELSIVLVIIGLLIGGILAAQSMVGTSKLQSTIRQIQLYDVAVANFQTKYSALPGDAKNFTPAGNGDGYIDTDDCSDHNWEDFTEIKNFWIHLQQGGFIQGNITFVTTTSGPGFITQGRNINMPLMPFANNAVLVPLNEYGDLVNNFPCPWFTSQNPWGLIGPYDKYRNHWLIADKTQTRYLGNTVNPVFKPIDAQAIDSKIDDGKPLTGNVKGTRSDGVQFGAGYLACIKDFNDVNTSYSTALNTAQCELSIKMLSQVGQ